MTSTSASKHSLIEFAERYSTIHRFSFDQLQKSNTTLSEYINQNISLFTDLKKTTFNITSGHYEYSTMLFGLVHAPFSFSSIHQRCPHRYGGKVHENDFSINSNSLIQHVQHIKKKGFSRLFCTTTSSEKQKCVNCISPRSHYWVVSQEDVVMDSPSSSRLAHFPKHQRTIKSPRVCQFQPITSSTTFITTTTAPLQHISHYS